MSSRVRALARASSFVLPVLLATFASAQELPKSGVFGQNYFWATSPGGQSQLFASRPALGGNPIALGTPVNSVPSRWAHRRRTLGALETEVISPLRGVLLTPMGDAVGNGAIHLLDQRLGLQTQFVSVGNPPAYDLAASTQLQYVFCASDNGAGQTVLRGFSYSTVGTLTPLTPASLTLAGPPAAYVNRIGVEPSGTQLHVATATGVHVIGLSASAPQMFAGPFHSTAPYAPSTNPARFLRNGQPAWIVGTSTFTPPNTALEAGYMCWTVGSIVGTDVFGTVPSAPAKKWVPAAGTEELAVVGNGTDAYVYYLLREPGPGTFFVKPSSIGVVRFLGASAPAVGTLLMADSIGEPFANPAVHGTRVAFESSFGPPFIHTPPDGGEKISIVYSPLDPLGVSAFGVVGNPDPLGGRISTKGMDRPIWSRDGSMVMAATSHFPGAPHPGVPGIEVLAVPADVRVDEFAGPVTVHENLPFPNQAIIFPSRFDPSVPSQATELDGLSFFGAVFNQGLASVLAPDAGAIGQFHAQPGGFVQPPTVPNFRSILPPTFDDVNGSLTPIPGHFGARRTAFNYATGTGFTGVTMSAAIDDGIYVQRTGVNFQAALGVGDDLGVTANPLPSGWITTSEILSI